ncbi:MAG: DUF4149 domain-containing protein [Vampirovibrionales bacterium]|nr:DUF4149 domain-containing protein [Vampirovibrionales bacterium]
MMLGFLTAARVCNAIYILGLALATGGIITAGAFVAPALFKTLPRPDAALAMGQIFRRFDGLLIATIALTGLGQLGYASLSLMFNKAAASAWTHGAMAQPGLLFWARLILTAMLIALLAYTVWGLNPQLFRLQSQVGSSAEAAAAFTALHKQSETLLRLAWLLATALLISTPF